MPFYDGSTAGPGSLCSESANYDEALYNFSIYVVVVGVFSVAGILLNAFASIVFANMAVSPTKLLLRAESAIAAVYCLLLIPVYVCPHVYPFTGQLATFYKSQIYFKVYFSICQDMTLHACIWITVWACHHRYVEICWASTPTSARYNLSLAYDEIKVILAISVTIYLPPFFDSTLHEVADECYPSRMIVQRSFNQMGKSRIYLIAYKLLFVPLLQYVAPMVLLVRDSYRVHTRLSTVSERRLRPSKKELAMAYFRWEDDTVATELDKHAYVFMVSVFPNVIYSVATVSEAVADNTGPSTEAFDRARPLTLALIVAYVAILKAAMFFGLYESFRTAARDNVVLRVMQCFWSMRREVRHAIDAHNMDKRMAPKLTLAAGATERGIPEINAAPVRYDEHTNAAPMRYEEHDRPLGAEGYRCTGGNSYASGKKPAAGCVGTSTVEGEIISVGKTKESAVNCNQYQNQSGLSPEPQQLFQASSGADAVSTTIRNSLRCPDIELSLL